MRTAAILPALCLLVVGCGDGQQQWDPGLQRMVEQPRFDRYDTNPVFADGATLQPPPPHSVPRERELEHLPGARRGDGSWRSELPLPLDRELLALGRAGWERECASCHGVLGDGDSFVAVRMRLVPPADLLREEYRHAPLGRLYAVASDGYGAMAGYREVLPARERWAIVAWLRVLQRSQHQRLAELSPARRARIEELLP